MPSSTAVATNIPFKVPRAGVWVSVDGDVLYEDGGLVGDTLSTDSLGLDDGETTAMVEFGVRLPVLFDVYGGFSGFSTDGSGNLSEDFVFGDQTYSAVLMCRRNSR